MIEIGPNCRLDLLRGRIFDAGGQVRVVLSTRDVALLRYFHARSGRDVGREELLTNVCGYSSAACSRAVDTSVARLRQKLGKIAGSDACLVTVHGVGYRWLAQGSETDAKSIDRGVTGEAAARPGRAHARSAIRKDKCLRFADRVVDLDRLVVTTGEGEWPLTSAEGRLLEILIEAGERWVPLERLASHGCRGERAARQVKNTIYRLRRKLETDSSHPSIILSSRHLGYRLSGLMTDRVEIEVPSVVWSVARHLSQSLRLEDCVVYLLDGGQLRQVAAFGPKSPTPGTIVSPITLAVGEGVVGSVARSGRVKYVGDTHLEPNYVPDVFPGRSELAVPILDRGRVVGVIDSESSHPRAFEHHDPVFRSMSDVLASALRDMDWSPRA